MSSPVLPPALSLGVDPGSASGAAVLLLHAAYRPPPGGGLPLVVGWWTWVPVAAGVRLRWWTPALGVRWSAFPRLGGAVEQIALDVALAARGGCAGGCAFVLEGLFVGRGGTPPASVLRCAESAGVLLDGLAEVCGGPARRPLAVDHGKGCRGHGWRARVLHLDDRLDAAAAERAAVALASRRCAWPAVSPFAALTDPARVPLTDAEIGAVAEAAALAEYGWLPELARPPKPPRRAKGAPGSASVPVRSPRRRR